MITQSKSVPDLREELTQLLKEGKITGFIDKDGDKFRLAMSTSGRLCYFLGKSKTEISYLPDMYISGFVEFIYSKPKVKIDGDTINYMIIEEYRKRAMKASAYLDDNRFINRCKNLPASKKEWEEQGKKTLVDFDLSSGKKNAGTIISLKTIAKELPEVVNKLREAIKTKTDYDSGYVCYKNSMLNVFVNYQNGVSNSAIELKNKNNNVKWYLQINDDTYICYEETSYF